MTNKEIQNWIEDNMYHPDGTPMIDVQTFYEGAKWMRDKALSLHNVAGETKELIAFKNFLQIEYHLPVSNRMVDEFKKKQSS